MMMARHSERSEAQPRNPGEITITVAQRNPSAALGMTAFFAQLPTPDAIHDIAPPIHYSLIPLWVIFLGSVIALVLLGLLVWLGSRLFRKGQRVLSPRERAEEALFEIEKEIESTPPYQFSIRVSDVLRRYVLEQFDLPMTRQTSIEFLNSLTAAGKFSDDEKLLLADFLERCDLIKFARYEATADDSRRLLEEARRFVQGGTLVPA